MQVLHRTAKEGLGAAYLAGFRWALQRGYDAVVEMDADGSHQPEQLPRLLEALGHADVVLGSRWVPGGRVENWPAHRLLLSRGGNTYTRLALGIPVRDATGGYRAFRSTALEALDLDEVASQGYCFQVDLAWRAVQRGLRVVEVPITFVERVRGDSKMSGAIVRESLLRVTEWGARHRLAQLRGLARRRRVGAQRGDARVSPRLRPRQVLGLVLLTFVAVIVGRDRRRGPGRPADRARGRPCCSSWASRSPGCSWCGAGECGRCSPCARPPRRAGCRAGRWPTRSCCSSAGC